MRSFPTLAVVGYYDLLFVGSLCVLTMLLIAAAGARLATWLARVHLGLITFCVVFGLANIKIVWSLGQPLTYSWLAYSDFFSGLTARTAIKSEMTGGTVCYGLVVLILFVVIRFFLVHALALLSVVIRNRWTPVIIILMAGLGYFPVVGIHLLHTDWDPSKVQDATWTFLRSCFSRNEFIAAQNSKSVIGEDAPPQKATFAATWRVKAHPPKNIIFFVMESLGTEYLDFCGGDYSVTPTLSRYQTNAVQFQNIFANCPQTDKSMVSLLCGIYPAPSYKSITKDYPHLNLTSLSSLLKARDYRTAWFEGSDLKFARCNEFLANRGLDAMEDCFGRLDRCPIISTGRVNADGTCDDCTVHSMVDWILADTNRPFFAVAWTAQTHVPYWFCGSQQTNFGSKNRNFNLYLNAVMKSNRAFSILMASLEAAHVADDTLVIVVGDHGEVFDESRSLMGLHANHISDGTTHVPCLLINNRLFSGHINDLVGSLLDVPATVLDILGIDTPKGWQGTSLFSQRRPDGIFRHTSVGRELFGYRDAHMDWIYDAESRKWEVFDIRNDPSEKHNLAAGLEKDCAAMKLKMLEWVQGQQAYIMRHLPQRTGGESRGIAQARK